MPKINDKHMRALDIALEYTHEYGCKLLYLTEYGSTLYGTNSDTSDVDYKGVYAPSQISLLLKIDKYNITHTSNSTASKNTEKDIDLQLYSIHMFMDLLEKGEGSAIEILFSVFRNDTTVFIDVGFRKMVLDSWKLLVSKKLNAFVSYCLGQTKKYGIKGERLKELDSIIPILESYAPEHKLSRYQLHLENIINQHKYGFISFIQGMDGSKSEEVTFLEVLGRKFLCSTTFGYVIERLKDVQKDYGLRTKKALSHAVRIVYQLEELCETGFITFPLKKAQEIKTIKYGDMHFNEYQDLLERIGTSIDELKIKIENSNLSDVVDRKILDMYILQFVKGVK